MISHKSLLILRLQEKGRHAAARLSDEEKEILLVYKRIPNWRRIVLSKKFEDWLEEQPDRISKLKNSVKAADAIKMIRLYQAR